MRRDGMGPSSFLSCLVGGQRGRDRPRDGTILQNRGRSRPPKSSGQRRPRPTRVHPLLSPTPTLLPPGRRPAVQEQRSAARLAPAWPGLLPLLCGAVSFPSGSAAATRAGGAALLQTGDAALPQGRRRGSPSRPAAANPDLFLLLRSDLGPRTGGAVAPSLDLLPLRRRSCTKIRSPSPPATRLQQRSDLRFLLQRPKDLSTESDAQFLTIETDCIGAIDGTHIRASVPKDVENSFRGRKSYPTQNVMAAVDFDLRFTYVLAGWEGTAHDALILRDALERENGLRVPQGKFYLVDAGYGAKPGFLPPFRGVRYHLNEWGSNPVQNELLFNLRHSSLRVTVERAFGSLKRRFKVLDDAIPFFPFPTQVDIVVACCIIHNFVIQDGCDEFIIPESNWQSHTHATTSRGQANEHAATVTFRQQIADQMWQDRQNHYGN